MAAEAAAGAGNLRLSLDVTRPVLHLASVSVAFISQWATRPFVKSVMKRTLIGRLLPDLPGEQSDLDDSSREVLIRHVTKLRESLIQDFCYVVDLAASYLVFLTAGIAALGVENHGVRTAFTLASIVAIASWRFVVEGETVADYYRQRRFGISWQRVQLLLALALNMSVFLD